MPRRISPDRALLALVVILTAFGVVMVGSASSYYSLNRTGMTVPYQFLLRQIVYAAAGLFLMHRLMKTDYHLFSRRGVALGLVGVTVLLLLAVFLFDARKGTHRWIPLGMASFQPSELAKFVVVVFLAYMVEKKGEAINITAVGTVPCYAVAGLLAGLIFLEPDLGTALVLMLVTTIVLFAAGMRRRWIAGLAAAAVVALPVLIFSAPYRARRLLAFLHPGDDLRGPNFQLFQSEIAIGSGGLLGSGVGQGQQKWLFLPEAHTDFIFSVIGEEMGLLGTLFLLSLFVLVFWRGMRVSRRAPDRFGAFLALGITMFLVCQALTNMAVATGLLPTKGLPLPFVSYGGSSLIVTLGMSGVLLNVSQQAT